MVDVILVDENDNEIGVEEKIKAHEDGKLHRAFSIFIFNSNGEMLLQQRAKTSITLAGYGPMHVAATRGPMKRLKMQSTAD